MPCLTELHSLFYLNGSARREQARLRCAAGVKIIPQDIYNMLTPVALAHMVMGDGSVSRHGLILCTNSYSVQDVVRLMNVLIIRYIL